VGTDVLLNMIIMGL